VLVAWSHRRAMRPTDKQMNGQAYQRSKPTMGIEPITYHLQGGCSTV
jgi:hypothetical protein